MNNRLYFFRILCISTNNIGMEIHQEHSRHNNYERAVRELARTSKIDANIYTFKLQELARSPQGFVYIDVVFS